MIRRLLTPFGFLFTRDKKHEFRTIRLLAILLGAMAAAAAAYPSMLTIFGTNGLIHHGAGMLRILCGLYVAALGLSHTLKMDGLDEPVLGEVSYYNPFIQQRVEGPTLRHFLAVLFGYLAATALSLYVVGMVASIFLPAWQSVIGTATEHLGSWPHPSARAAFCLLYVTGYSHLLLTTAHGLYLLGDRLHRLREGGRYVYMDKDGNETDPS